MSFCCRRYGLCEAMPVRCCLIFYGGGVLDKVTEKLDFIRKHPEPMEEEQEKAKKLLMNTVGGSSVQGQILTSFQSLVWFIQRTILTRQRRNLLLYRLAQICRIME